MPLAGWQSTSLQNGSFNLNMPCFLMTRGVAMANGVTKAQQRFQKYLERLVVIFLKGDGFPIHQVKYIIPLNWGDGHRCGRSFGLH